MFEELIASLDGMGVQYAEDYESGSLTIQIADVDKATLIEVINAVLATGALYTIDATTIAVSGGAPVEAPEEQPTDMQAAALAEMPGF